MPGAKSSKSVISAKKALVRWVGGEDDGEHHIVDLSWLKNFDAKKWKDTDEDARETEICEWRLGRKNPSGNWDCYDCYVLEIADQVSPLQKRMKQLKEAAKAEGGKSKRSTVEESDDDEDVGKDSDSDSEPLAKKNKSEKQEKIAKSKSDDSAMMELQRQNAKLLALLEKKLTADGNSDNNGKASGSKKLMKEAVMVPLYDGCNFLVDKVALDAAIGTKRLSSFLNDLLPQLFDECIFVVCNINGGKAKVPIEGHIQRFPLPKKRRQALTNAAQKLFPSAKVSEMHTIITRKINNIRFHLRKEGKLAAVEEEGVRRLSEANEDDANVENSEDSTVKD